jgi:hypothetical protein
MSIDRAILYGSIVLIVILLLIFIPRKMIRVALTIFLFKQIITWILGVLVVEMDLVRYPVRLIEMANRTSFLFEYIVYPSICAIFITHYPEHKSKLYKFGYYAFYCSLMSGIEELLEHTTDLIDYIHWAWYWTWLSLFFTFWLARQFYKWYFYKLLKSDQVFSE